MPNLRRLAAPALSVALALGTSGCAVGFSTGCGLTAVDPMSDGASRLSTGFHRHQAVAHQQALQQKAMMVGMQQGVSFRRPGQPIAQQPVSAFCFR